MKTSIFDIADIGSGSVGLVFVNSGGSTLANAAGISVSDDLIVVAYISYRTFLRLQFFSHKDGRAFKRCPYYHLFLKHIIPFEDEFPRGRILLDAATQARCVGFNPEEMVVSEKSGSKFIAVPTTSLESMVARLGREDGIRQFFTPPKTGEVAKPRNVFVHAREFPESIEAMIAYYWSGLRTVNGQKTLIGAADRTEPIRAIVYALAAESIAFAKCEPAK